MAVLNVKNKLVSGCWALSRLKPFVNQDTLRKVYFGLVHSALHYCVSCWGNTSQCYLEPLNVLNKRALRIISNVPWNTHTLQIFHKHNILTFKDTYTLQIIKIMHQIHNNNYEGKFKLKLAKQVHQHSTRFSNTSNYFRQTFTLNTTSQALCIIGPKIWSEIPNDIKSLNYKLFISKYKNYLIEQYSQI